MQIFLHTENGLTLETVDETTTVGSIAEDAGIADATGWLEDVDEPLDLAAEVGKVVGAQGHLHIGRCRKVEVTINFAGKTINSRARSQWRSRACPG